jgi:hypothetical protein
MKQLAILACMLTLSAPAWASDHGPVFGYATPVNSQGEFSFDTGLFGRYGSQGTQFSTGSQIGYGLTPHLTFTGFVPATFGSGSLPETRIFPGGEWYAGASWRFFHSVTQVGKRLEATGTLGIVVPGPQPDSGILGSLHRAPGIAGTLATGVASRSHYLWAGGGYTWFPEADQTQRPSTLSWSGVYGYRPAKLRRGYDQWDYRGLLELTGEHTTAVRLAGAEVPNSSSTSLWLGPAVLAIFKDVAIEGGVQGPLFRDVSESVYGREKIRFAINFSYLKFSSRTSTH